MWQSLIKSDLEGIKQSSKALGVEEMYGLLACILTARSWDVITTGIDRGPVTDEEVCNVKAFEETVFVVVKDEIINVWQACFCGFGQVEELWKNLVVLLIHLVLHKKENCFLIHLVIRKNKILEQL